MKYLLLIISFALWISPLNAKQVPTQSSASVVKVFTHSIDPNYKEPWNIGISYSGTGSGVIIKGNLILTAAHVVTNSTYIEIKKYEDPKKYFAKVKWIAHDADLALLEVEDKSFFEGTVAKDIGTTPKRQDDVAVYGYPEGGNKISITKGIISRIEVTTYAHSINRLLTIQIDAAINPGNSGGPAFDKNGNIVGIAIQALSKSNNIGYIAPVPVIKHFLEDIKDGAYDGFPDDGIIIQTMENKDLKAFYKMETRTGVLVKNVISNSSADGYVEKEDIILEIDGFVISDDNSVNIKKLGSVSSGYIVQQHFIGENLKLKILRNAKEIEVFIPLKRSCYITTYDHLGNPRYYIFGGFVFVPLSMNYYVKVDGTSDYFLYQHLYSNVVYSEQKKKEVVLINTLLLDKVNAGYSASNMIVDMINDVKVTSLEHLVTLIKSSKINVKITTLGGNVYVLNKKSAMEAEARILKRYRIKAPYSLGKN